MDKTTAAKLITFLLLGLADKLPVDELKLALGMILDNEGLWKSIATSQALMADPEAASEVVRIMGSGSVLDQVERATGIDFRKDD